MEYLDVSGVAGKAVKVVHVIIGLNVGGAELMLKRLIESHGHLEDIDHSVISLTDLGPIGTYLVEKGVSVYGLGMSSAVKGPIIFFKLRSLLKRLQPDIVHTWMYHSDLLGGLAARSIGIDNVVWCIRSTDITKGGSRLTIFIRKLCAWSSVRLPRVIVCAAHASRKVHEEVGYAPKKIQVIPNGFDLEKLTPSEDARERVRNEVGIGQDVKVVASVGRFNPVKDHRTFIEAATKVAKKHQDVRFMLVGRDLEHSNSALMAMINATGRPEIFYLLGERNDVPACLKASDIFCLHSVTEGFPNVLGEAMALGLPCITTDVGDAAHLLGDPEWVVPAACPDRLADKLIALLALPEAERVALGNNSASRIREEFSMDKVSRRYYDIYASLLNL